MRTLTNRKKALLALVLITMVIYGPFVLMMNQPFITNAKNTQNNDPINENILNDIPSSSGVGSWWNASFRYRVEIQFQEPGYYNRSNEPVDVYIMFDAGRCHKDTIRVLLYQLGDTWVETPYQIWNKTMYDTTYVKSCSITFLTTIEKDDSESYYVYYSDSNDNGNIINPLNKYLQTSSLSSDFDGKKLTVLNSEFALEMEEGSGINNFTKQNQNYNTEYSLSPWIKEGIVNSSIYSPDPAQGGAIHNWLVVGPFDYFNPDWNHPITDTAYHIDPSENYIQGDNATGGDAPSIFLDENKQWGYKEFSTYSTYASNHGYMDLDQYFGHPDTVCAYLSVYIMSPVDLPSVYLKVGSDDGIRIWRDGVKIHNNHVLRGPQPDREITGIPPGPLSFEAGVWYNYIVLVEENTGGWGFNFRFSNNSNLYGNTPQNDPDSITNLNIAIQPPLPVIQTISEVQVGPVFSQYELTWEDSGDMKIFDTITFYSDYNSWKLERTLWWADDRVNLSFSILNTLIDNTNNVFDDYLYDYTWTESGMNNPSFSPQKYSVIWDSDGTKNLMALGIFLTEFEKGNQFIELSELSWGISYDSTHKIANFQPGKETNLDNKGPHLWPGDSDYNIKFTFWEYLDNDFASTGDYSAANDTASGIYDSLIHPLVQVKDLEESSFFDLTVNVTDHDGFNVENVKVYVYNSTDDEVSNGYTNEEGIISFLRLPKGNYILNFTYSDIMSEFPVKSNVAVELNESKTISVGDLSLTSLNLKFQQLDPPRAPLSGVDVEFWYKNSTTGDLEFLINTLETDDEGMVSFYWKNTSQTVANISVRAFLLGEYRDINNSVSGLGNQFLNYTFENRATDTISIQISSYTTDMEFIEPIAGPITDKFKGDSIDFKIRYWYELGGNIYNISDASVTYIIRNSFTDAVVGTGSFYDDIYPIGFYNYSLDTSIVNMISGVPYQMSIIADKPGYVIKTITISIVLKTIWTNLTAENNEINIDWKDMITFRVYYNDTLNGQPIKNATVAYTIPGRTGGTLTYVLGQPGWYEVSFNSTQLINAADYVIAVGAIKDNYQFQEIFIDLSISLISTELIPDSNQIVASWGNTLSLSVFFNDTSNDREIANAVVSYRILGTIMLVQGTFDNIGNGVYYIELSSLVFESVGSYFLRITASQSNYEPQTIDVQVIILPISTLINGSVVIYESVDVVVGNEQIFQFNYTVTSTGSPLFNSSIHSCEWERKNNLGETIDNGIVQLIDLQNGLYELDFNTEKLQIGTYSLAISIGKTNYAERTAIIILNILPKLFEIILSDTKFDGNIISIISGNSLEFTITINDYYASTAISGTEVYLTFQGTRYDLTDNLDGTYTVVISKLPDAFFNSQQFEATINAKSDNFTDGEKNIFIVVKMTEIFPGFPMFYFLIIVIGVVAVVGSLVAYRQIQRARIPKFIKKVSAMKKEIKGRKSISESLLYPSKEEYIATKFGDKWAVLGLSLEDILGLGDKKGKKLPESTEPKGGAE